MGVELVNPEDLKFKDSEGDVWSLKITLAEARLIDQANYEEVTKVPFSIMEPSRDFFGEVAQNVNFAMFMAYVIVREQFIEKLNLKVDDSKAGQDGFITEDKAQTLFVKRLDGDAIHSARGALLRALADFIPSQRTALLRAQDSMEKATARLNMEMASLAGQIDQVVAQRLDQGAQELRSHVENFSREAGVTSTPPSASSDGLQARLGI